MNLAALLLAAALVLDGEAANRDIAAHPPAVQPFLRYASTQRIAAEDQAAAARALALVVASASPQPIIERATPQPIGPTLYRLNLLDLQIRPQDWDFIVRDYPYSAVVPARVVRADWLALELSDCQENPDAYYRIVYGGRIPKTRDEALELLGVSADPGERVGIIAGESGVSKTRVRYIEKRPMTGRGGWAWGTRDVLKLDNNADPLEHPAGDFKHDGEEWIIGRLKYSSARRVTGALQVYFLANGQGQIVQRAPVDLVEDFGEFRGLREIRNAGSCIGCHDNGLNLPSKDEFLGLLDSGVRRIEQYGEARDRLEAFFYSDLGKDFRRANEDYAAAVNLVCGCTGEEAAAAFKAAVDRYDAPLDLERAALESYVTAETLAQTIALASASGGKLPARIIGLTAGGTCPRSAWEADWLAVRNELYRWGKLK